MKMTPSSDSPDRGPASFYNASSYKPEDSIGYLMRQILSTVAVQVEHQLAHTELTNAQWIPLFKIYSGQATTVAELARACHHDAGAMTRTLDRLEAKGLCSRTRSVEDRRVVNIALTEAGQLAAQDIPRVLSGIQNNVLTGFSATEFENLRSYLRRILQNAKRISAENPTPLPGDSHAP
jgi:DNA-binding MarR family transcriptional regulator